MKSNLYGSGFLYTFSKKDEKPLRICYTIWINKRKQKTAFYESQRFIRQKAKKRVYMK